MLAAFRTARSAVLSLAALFAAQQGPEVRVWVEHGPRESCVDVLFVGDGYVAKHLGRAGKYWKDVERCSKRLFAELPFSWYAERFNVRALLLESEQDGCDASQHENERRTALDSCFDTADGRLLTFRANARLRELVAGAGGADIVFVMVNSERYGGAGTVLAEPSAPGGFIPAPTYSAQDTRSFLIAIHELGHSFAGLADEYVDEAAVETYRLPEDPRADLAEPNVTLRVGFDPAQPAKTLKWRHFLALPGAEKYDWVHEGGFFREKDVFRPFAYCLMRDHEERFCPVCAEEVSKAILRTCGLEWDDAAYHLEHPLDRKTWPRKH